jgi:hypothetical protein
MIRYSHACEFAIRHLLIWSRFLQSDFDLPAFWSVWSRRSEVFRMPRATGDATLLIQSLSKAYAATPTNLKVPWIWLHFPFLITICCRFNSLSLILDSIGVLSLQIIDLYVVFAVATALIQVSCSILFLWLVVSGCKAFEALSWRLIGDLINPKYLPILPVVDFSLVSI